MDTSLHPARGVMVAGEGRTLHLLDATITYKVTGATTHGAWSLLEYIAPPYYGGLPAHWHERTLETCYVVAGTMALTLDDHTITVSRGAVIAVPPGVRHTFFNPTAAPVTLLMWFSPSGCEEYFEALAPLLAAEPSRPLAEQIRLAQLWRTFDLHHPSD